MSASPRGALEDERRSVRINVASGTIFQKRLQRSRIEYSPTRTAVVKIYYYGNSICITNPCLLLLWLGTTTALLERLVCNVRGVQEGCGGWIHTY